MKNHLKEYKEKLEEAIGEYMQAPVSERNASAVSSMLECLEEVEERLEKLENKTDTKKFTREDSEYWVSHMNNDNGTTGAHWDISETTAVANSIGLTLDHIYDYDWWAAMNMIYSDYCSIAEKYGVGIVEFYADMAKAFLFDKDGGNPVDKLSAYYHNIVCKK